MLDVSVTLVFDDVFAVTSPGSFTRGTPGSMPGAAVSPADVPEGIAV